MAAVCLVGCSDDDEDTVTIAPISPAEAAYLDGVYGYDDAVLFGAGDPTVDPFLEAALLPDAPSGDDTGGEVSTAAAGQDTLVAQAAATNAGNYFTPSGCVNAVPVNNTVTYGLNDCTGPLGMKHLRGTLNAVFTAQDGSNMVTVTSDQLKSGDVSIDFNAQGTLTQVNGVRTLHYTSQSTTSGPAGNVGSRQSQGTLTWNKGDTCARHDGTGTATLDGRSIRETQTGVVRCTNQCPKSGTLTVDRQGKVMSISYNGSDKPPVVSDGQQIDVTLMCGAQ